MEGPWEEPGTSSSPEATALRIQNNPKQRRGLGGKFGERWGGRRGDGEGGTGTRAEVALLITPRANARLRWTPPPLPNPVPSFRYLGSYSGEQNEPLFFL